MEFVYFSSPVGTQSERESGIIWPGGWFDATGFATRYRIGSPYEALHTGADVNINTPHFDADKLAPAFGALDEMTRNRLNEELLALRERSRFTALFVTHSVSEAVFLSNRVVVMSANPGREHGEVRVDFPYPRPAALRGSPEFLAKVNEVTQLLHQVEATS